MYNLENFKRETTWKLKEISNFQLLTLILVYIFVNYIVFYALDQHSLIQLLNTLTSISSQQK